MVAGFRLTRNDIGLSPLRGFGNAGNGAKQTWATPSNPSEGIPPKEFPLGTRSTAQEYPLDLLRLDFLGDGQTPNLNY